MKVFRPRVVHVPINDFVNFQVTAEIKAYDPIDMMIKPTLRKRHNIAGRSKDAAAKDECDNYLEICVKVEPTTGNLMPHRNAEHLTPNSVTLDNGSHEHGDFVQEIVQCF